MFVSFVVPIWWKLNTLYLLPSIGALIWQSRFYVDAVGRREREGEESMDCRHHNQPLSGLAHIAYSCMYEGSSVHKSVSDTGDKSDNCCVERLKMLKWDFINHCQRLKCKINKSDFALLFPNNELYICYFASFNYFHLLVWRVFFFQLLFFPRWHFFLEEIKRKGVAPTCDI